MCVCVERVAKSHFHVNQEKKETKRLETNMYKYVMRGVCFGAPQPRWFAISQKNINGRTWQEATDQGLGQAQYYDII